MLARVVAIIGVGFGSSAVWVTLISRAWRPRGTEGKSQLQVPEQQPEASGPWEPLDQALVYARAEARLAGMARRMRQRYGASSHGWITGSQQPALRCAALKSGLQLGDPVDARVRLDEVIIWNDGPSPPRKR